MAEGLTTALNLQKPPVNDLCRQGAEMALTFKMALALQSRLQSKGCKGRKLDLVRAVK
jgi:hypothetical protein